MEKTSDGRPDYTRLRAHLYDKATDEGWAGSPSLAGDQRTARRRHSLKDMWAWLNEILVTVKNEPSRKATFSG
jgi:hypothetical protein